MSWNILSSLNQRICFIVLCVCMFVCTCFQFNRVMPFSVIGKINRSSADTAFSMLNITSFARKLNGSSADTAFSMLNITSFASKLNGSSADTAFSKLNTTPSTGNLTGSSADTVTSMFNTTSFTGKRCFRLSWNLSPQLNKLDSRTNKHAESKLCRRFLNIDNYIGRMGNHIFQFASLLGMAYEYDVIPIIQGNSFLAKYFDLPNQSDLRLQNIIHCHPRNGGSYYNCTKEFNTTSNNGSMHGYLQSWKYFEKSRTIIKQALKMKNNHLENARRFIAEVSIPGHQIVCIHVRRGDFTSKEKSDFGYTVAGRDFIERARRYYIQEFSKVKFIVVSDDKSWCRDNINGTDLSPFIDASDDMALLTSCDHVVVTSGSFGWWGAWLSGGRTVYFKGFPRSGSTLDTIMNKEDYYPPSWISIP